jgi:hypothetical protein
LRWIKPRRTLPDQLAVFGRWPSVAFRVVQVERKASYADFLPLRFRRIGTSFYRGNSKAGASEVSSDRAALRLGRMPGRRPHVDLIVCAGQFVPFFVTSRSLRPNGQRENASAGFAARGRRPRVAGPRNESGPETAE